jgi:prolyl oligopeptidase
MHRALLILLAAATALTAQIRYPDSTRGAQVDTYHGIEVADPYRWLEGDVRHAPDVAAWVEAQNAVTFAYLAEIPERARIHERLTAIVGYERFGLPARAGKRYAWSKNDGLQNQNVLMIAAAPDAAGEVLIDPNTWSKDGTMALAGTSFSDDGRYLAYAIAEAGSDWRVWRVMDVATKKVLDDELRWSKFTGVAWTRDGRGFFYARFEKPPEGAAFQGANLGQKVWYHRVGTPQTDDVLVYWRPECPEWTYSPEVSEDGRYLILSVSKGAGSKRRVLVRDLAEPYALPTELIATFADGFDFIGQDGCVLYFRTDRKAPRGRLIAIDLRDPAEDRWTEILPQRAEALASVSMVGGTFVATYLEHASSAVAVHRKDGRLLRQVELPGIGTAAGFGGRAGDAETFFSFSSFATPPSIYRHDVITGETTLLRSPKIDADTAKYAVQRAFYTSKDGTKVPLFVAHKKGLALDGANPTILYGYGGFNISQMPSFSAARLAWMEMGGVFALACLRGGGEYGEEWHAAGTKLKKQNVFDDFIAAAEWLCKEKYTSPKRLAIQGGSNGGLLVGACMIQRPDLFGACLPAVGVMDMLRFESFTAGRYWTEDYGSVKNTDEFAALRAYSPYHNLKKDAPYPATLITTADTDDRVVPGHSFKFAAQLQHCQAGAAPVLIRIETRAGHGAGKPTKKMIEEVADQWAFTWRALGMSDARE